MKKDNIYMANFRLRKREEKAKKLIKQTDLNFWKLKQLFFSTPRRLWGINKLNKK